MKDYDPMFDEFPEDDPLIATPCDCAEWRRLNEACADLLAENKRLKEELSTTKNAVQILGEDVYNLTEKVLPNVRAERDEWKRLFTLNANDEGTVKDAERYRWLRDRIKKSYGMWFIDARIGLEGPTETDAAIDAAMQETQE